MVADGKPRLSDIAAADIGPGPRGAVVSADGGRLLPCPKKRPFGIGPLPGQQDGAHRLLDGPSSGRLPAL